MQNRWLKSKVAAKCLMTLSMSACFAYQMNDRDINGYWQIRSSDSQLFGVIYLHLNQDHLIAQGIRLNVVNPKQKINWICTYGHPSLKDKAVWGGGVLMDMQRSDDDASYFYNGTLSSAVGCVILHPRILFSSKNSATMTISSAVDYLDYDKAFTNTITYHLEKISRKKALQNCSHTITTRDKERWGDLVNSPKARQAMLKDLGLTKKTWLKLANEYKICFDH